MSVEEQLGLGVGSNLLEQADDAWSAWRREHPRLAVARDTASLRTWLHSASADDANEVLLVLAQLAAVDGGDDMLAGAVLAWALVPGAGVVAHRLRDLSKDIDTVVAGQLWEEVRTFPWRRLTKVPANILMNVRAGALRECGVRAQVERDDQTWSRTILFAPEWSFWERPASDHAATQPAGPDAVAAELEELLEWACETDVITAEDRTLLLCLVGAADGLPLSRRKTCGGLMAHDLNVQVAGELGMSVRTLRRRTRKSIDALAGASKCRYSA